MTQDNLQNLVRKQVVETLTEIQRNAGREVPPITDDTIPFDHLPGFDSVNGVEAAVVLSERVNVEINDLRFVAIRTGKHMAVRDIVDGVIREHGAQIAAKVASSRTPVSTSSSSAA